MGLFKKENSAKPNYKVTKSKSPVKASSKKNSNKKK